MIKGAWQIDGDGISGWAELEGAASPLWLELLVDGEPMAIALANRESDQGAGFWLPLPAVAQEEEAELKVRLANTNLFLEQCQPEQESGPGLVSELSVDRGLVITGWAYDSGHSDEKLTISAIVDDEVVASTVADRRRYRPLLADGHGFWLQLPQSMADGELHEVRIIDSRGRTLEGSPVRVRSAPKRASAILDEQKKPDKATLKLIAGLLDDFENLRPGMVLEGSYQDWKNTFPVEAPGQRQKAALELIADADKALLKNQQGVELKFRPPKPDYHFSAGGATACHPALMASLLREMRASGAGLVYADGEADFGLFKPAWDREAFLAQDYLGPFLASPQAVAAAEIRPEDADFEKRLKIALAAEKLGGIRHLPTVLANHPLSASQERGLAVGRWLAENIPGASWQDGRVKYECRSSPRISILIPTRDKPELLASCLDSLRQTNWPDYEVIIIDNGSEDEDALSLLRRAEAEGNCILRLPGVFNYAYLNNEAAKRATGEYLCFLNNDTEALHPDWLTELAAILLQAGEEGGCAGAKLLWPNGLVQHAGVVVGINQLAGHVGNQWLADEPGYMNRNQFAQQYSAVTAACLLTSRKLFLDMGGYDERRFPIAFNDTDYCLRLGAQGKKVFWTPHSRLMHHESASRGGEVALSAQKRSLRETRLFRLLWSHYDDRFYNPNLPLSAAGEPFMGLAFPPRARLSR